VEGCLKQGNEGVSSELSLSKLKGSIKAMILHSTEVAKSDGIPASTLELATQKRQELIEQLAELDDEITKLFVNDALSSNAQLRAAIRRATVSEILACFSWLRDKEHSNGTTSRQCFSVPRQSN
jgi:translation elongation factor EF-G